MVSKEEYNRREKLMESIEYGIKEGSKNPKDSDLAKYTTFVAVDQYIYDRHKSYEEDILKQLSKLSDKEQSIDDTLGNIMDILDNDYETKI